MHNYSYTSRPKSSIIFIFEALPSCSGRTHTFRLFVYNSIRALSVATIFAHISCLVEHKSSGILAQGLALKMSVEQVSEHF